MDCVTDSCVIHDLFTNNFSCFVTVLRSCIHDLLNQFFPFGSPLNYMTFGTRTSDLKFGHLAEFHALNFWDLDKRTRYFVRIMVG